MKKTRLAFVAAIATVAFGMMLTGCGSDSASSADNGSSNLIKSTAVTASTTVPADVQVVNVTAKNFAWTLDKTEVKAGKPVELNVTGTEGFHGFTVDGTDIANVEIGSGTTHKILITPTQAGDLNIHCTIMCGVGHGEMHATLKVTQ